MSASIPTHHLTHLFVPTTHPVPSDLFLLPLPHVVSCPSYPHHTPTKAGSHSSSPCPIPALPTRLPQPAPASWRVFEKEGGRETRVTPPPPLHYWRHCFRAGGYLPSARPQIRSTYSPTDRSVDYTPTTTDIIHLCLPRASHQQHHYNPTPRQCNHQPTATSSSRDEQW